MIPKKITTIVDGGVRTGSDILKTMSLGADFVGIGRLIAYGILADSNRGVDTILRHGNARRRKASGSFWKNSKVEHSESTPEHLSESGPPA